MVFEVPSIPICLSYDFWTKTLTLMKIPLGKAITIFGITINPIVLGIIAGCLVVGTILTWIFRKQINNFLRRY